MRRHDAKRNRIPPLQHHPLEIQIPQLAARQHTPRIARLRDRRLDKRRKVSTAPELVLDAQAARGAKRLAPLRVDLALEVERTHLVREVARDEDEDEGDPGEEGVHGEEGAVVEQEAGPADEGGEDADAGGEGGGDELRAVTDAHDVGALEDVEPGEEAEDEGDEGVDG